MFRLLWKTNISYPLGDGPILVTFLQPTTKTWHNSKKAPFLFSQYFVDIYIIWKTLSEWFLYSKTFRIQILGQSKSKRNFVVPRYFVISRYFLTDCFDSTNLKLNYLEQELSYHGENKLFILHKKKWSFPLRISSVAVYRKYNTVALRVSFPSFSLT